MSKQQKVLDHLRKYGQIDNASCINGSHGFVSWRLGAIINVLKHEGLIELDNEKSGYIGDTKNWLYVVKPIMPKSITEYRVQGELVATKKLYI